MTNYEYLTRYKVEIAKEALAGNGIAKVNGEITICAIIDCNSCDFKSNEDCFKTTKQWLDEEHIEKPKPCPFCGSESVHVYTAADRKYVECGDCFAKTMFSSTEEEALSAWNRRA